MMPNRRSFASAVRSQRFPKAAVQKTLKSGAVQIERKTFFFALIENHLGRFLRITEEVPERRNAIVVPASGLEDFGRILSEMASSANHLPTKLVDSTDDDAEQSSQAHL